MAWSRSARELRRAHPAAAGALVAGGLALAALSTLLGSCTLRRPLPIDEAVDCRVARPATDRSTGDMQLVRLPESTARCNDGTLPTMYVRAATSQAHANDWVIQVEGGGNCSRNAQCQERWCTRNQLMSTTHAGHREGDGILAASRRNPFGDWNVVRLNYCTSDDWLGGTREAVVLDGMLSSVKMPFSGHLVLQQLLETLDAGAAADGVRMPELTEAEHLLWTGFSAGADGAAYNLDWVADRYPRAKTVGLIDSYLQPNADYFPGPSERLAHAFEAEWESVHTDVWHRFGPAGCDTGKCQNNLYLWAEVVRTPAVLHFDVRDPRVSDLYTVRDVQMSAFTAAAERTLREIASRRPDLSVIGSSCARHVVTTNEALFELTVADGGGSDISILDAVDRLMKGEGRVVAIDDPQGRSSHCPSRSIPDGDLAPTRSREQGGERR